MSQLTNPDFIAWLLHDDLEDRKGPTEDLPFIEITDLDTATKVIDESLNKASRLRDLSFPDELRDLTTVSIIKVNDLPLVRKPLPTMAALLEAKDELYPFLANVELPRNLCLCGGAVERIISKAREKLELQNQIHEPPTKKQKLEAPSNRDKDQTPNDLDFFFFGLKTADKAIDLANKFITKIGCEQLWHRGNVFETCTQIGDFKIQFIARLYENPREIINGFDLGSSQYAWYGGKFYTTKLGLLDLFYSVNVLDGTRRSLSYEYRQHKYMKRGHHLIVPYSNLFFERSADNPSLWYSQRLGIQAIAISNEFSVVPSEMKWDETGSNLQTREDISDYGAFEMHKNSGGYTFGDSLNGKIIKRILAHRIFGLNNLSLFSQEEVQEIINKKLYAVFTTGSFQVQIPYSSGFSTNPLNKQTDADLVRTIVSQLPDEYVNDILTSKLILDSEKCKAYKENALAFWNSVGTSLISTRQPEWIIQKPGSQITSSFNPTFSTFSEYAASKR
eukprot:TRINITY_DN10212_c0_g1_i4.p1 TRINITY_DN10212_c0_g1~~TRINITY_DN10212_c0_g1_i4.p1  ORF type:complete len:504 (+),score=61.10 TRINITY_DN10212_c0_g1_i4:57-1568(+)